MFTVTPPQPQASSSSSSSQQAQQQHQHQHHNQQQQHQQLLLQQQLLQQQQAAIIQQAMLQQQAALYHPAALLAAMSQIEPIPSGYLPPGFDASSCCSVYVGNIHPNVTDKLLAEVFGTVGLLKGCKLIKKEKSSFGFVEYFDHRSAAAAIMTLNGREIFSQCIKVNWAYASGQKEDTTGHFSIFVGDLSSDVADATLLNAFSIYPSCSDARVMWDQRTGRSRGFGFVFFKNQQEAQRAIDEMSGKWLGSRVIRCNWATRSGSNSASQTEANHALDGSATDSQQGSESFSHDAPENNPQYTTVYVGNLATEVNQVELYRLFHMLGAGAIEDVRVQRDKGFGFVRYHTHEEAALAIQLANGKIFYGKSIKCSWGNKPTAPGTLTSQQAAPVGSLQGMTNTGLGQGYTAADLMAYEKQLSQAGMSALLPVPGQQGTSMPLGGTGLGNRAGYDSF